MGGSCESTGRRNSASSTAAAAASTKSVSQAEALATQQLRRSGDHKHVLSSNSSVLKCQKNWTILIFFFRGCHFLYNNLGGLFRPQYFTHCLSIQSSMLVQFRPPLIPNETPAQPWKHRANGFVWKEVPKVPECMVQVVHTQNQSCKIPTRRQVPPSSLRVCSLPTSWNSTTQRRKCWWNAKGNETNINRPLPTNLGLGPSITLQTQSWANKQIVMMCKASRHENMTI